MAYNLKAVMELQDRFSNPLKHITKALNNSRRASDFYRDANGRLRDAQGRFAASTTLATSGLLVLSSTTNTATVSITALTAAFATATAAATPLLAAVGGLSASLAAASAGAAAFGVVASSSLSGIFEAADKVERINERIASATTATEYASAQKELQAIYSGLSAAQSGALKELQSFRSYWDTFKTGFEEPVFEAFAGGLRATRSLLEGLRPTITNVAEVTTRMMTQVNRAFSNGTTNTFFTWLEGNAARSIENFAKMAGNAFLGFTNMLSAFAPTGERLENSLVSMTERFRQWSETLATSKGFQDFLSYANQNGPALLGILSNMSDIAGKLVTALAPFGTTLLSGFERFTGLINNNWPIVQEAIVGATTALLVFKTASAGLMIYKGITAALAGFRTAVAAAAAGQWALNAATLAWPGTWVIAGIAGVTAAGVLLYRQWDEIKEKTIELWNTFDGWKGAMLGLLGPVGMLINAGKLLYEKWAPFRNLMDGVKNGWNKITGGGPDVSAPKSNGSHYNGLKSVPYDGYVATLHRGEEVRTAKEVQQDRKGGNIVNLSVYYQGGPKMDQADMELFSSYLVRRINQAGGAGA